MAGVITGSSLTRTVGEQLDLTAGVTGGSGVLSDFQWDIKGDPIKDYVGPPTNFAKGEKVSLPASDLTQRNVKFYWYKEGKFDVSVKYKLDGNPDEAKATYTIERPKVQSYTSKTGSVTVDGNLFGFIGSRPAHPGINGITWTAKVKRDKASEGKIAYIQLINPHREWTPGKKWTSSGSFVLDGADGKTKIFYWQLTVDLTGTGEATLEANDGPSNPLDAFPNALATSGKDTFKIYLMYKSSTEPSIWVPLQRLDWDWEGKAKRTTKTDPWAVDGTPVVTPDPGGNDTTEFPEWTKYYPNLGYT